MGGKTWWRRFHCTYMCIGLWAFTCAVQFNVSARRRNKKIIIWIVQQQPPLHVCIRVLYKQHTTFIICCICHIGYSLERNLDFSHFRRGDGSVCIDLCCRRACVWLKEKTGRCSWSELLVCTCRKTVIRTENVLFEAEVFKLRGAPPRSTPHYVKTLKPLSNRHDADTIKIRLKWSFM